MTIKTALLRANPVARLARKYLRSRRGSIAPMVALLIVPLVAIMGLATQGGAWFLMQRAMQNAADSAVIAAATNGGNGGSQTQYTNEANSITAEYGFANGTNNVHVYVPTPQSYPAVTSCVSPKVCYNVAINAVAPLYLLQLIGYTGNASTSGGGTGQAVTAGALATTITIQAPFCLLALGTSGAPVSTNGSPNSNLACNVQSNGNSNCNGHSITSGYSDSAGSQTGSKDCGDHTHDSQPTLSDPYANSQMSTNIANAIANAGAGNHCSGGNYYPQSSGSWPGGTNTLTGNLSLPAVSVYCGDVALGGNVTVTSPSSDGSVIIIENGMLNLNGSTLASASGSGVAIIFYSPQGAAEAYTGGGTPTNFICIRSGCANGGSGGALNISSPTTGTFSGISILQDMNLPLQGPTSCTGNDPWSYTGSSPTWAISGVVDLDRTNFCVGGNISQSQYGYTCLTIVDNSTIVNGTGNIFYQNPQSQCAQQGVTQITAAAYVIGQLVY